jgi:hypothetical protein
VKTILLPASTPLSYAVVAPLWARLADDPRIELVISARHGGGELAERCLGRPVRHVHRAFTRWIKADLALCPGFHYRRGRARLRVQMFHGVSFKNYAVSDDLAAFQRWMVIGEYHRRKLVRAGIAAEDDPRVLRVGMPKTDALLGSRAAGKELVVELGLDPALPTVAYAPTRSGSAGSSLEGFGLDALDALRALPINVLVKLHDRSDRRFRAELTRDYAAEIEARHRGGRVRVVREHDVVPVLLAADVLLSDLSSVANEFLLRDAPVLYLETPQHEAKLRSSAQRRFGDADEASFEWMREAGDVVRAADAVVPAVERALSDPSRRSAQRRERAALLFYNPGSATPIALRELYRLLELEPP